MISPKQGLIFLLFFSFELDLCYNDLVCDLCMTFTFFSLPCCCCFSL